MNNTNYQVPDYYLINDLLNDEQRLIRDSVRDWVNREVRPVINQYAQKAEVPHHFFKALADVGAFGPFIPEKYGGSSFDHVSYGLIMQELERGDSSVRSTASVQTSLVMYPIYEFGNEEQRQKYLPLLASGEIIGAFGLTEPNHGSDPKSMETHFVDKGSHYLLNGAKMWITNAPVADMAVVWAKNEAGRVRGLIVERGMEGFSAPETTNKWSLRASSTGELVFDNVKVPKANLLPDTEGLKGALMCLNSARYGIAWGAIGAATDCYATAVEYSLQRKQFGVPLASFQLTQKKLAEMLTEITKAQLLAWRLGTLKDAGKASAAQISMAKRNNVEMALKTARDSRQILGAMGITGDFPMMRHQMNLESVITYEGTHDIHLLITGMDITGIPAFQ